MGVASSIEQWNGTFLDSGIPAIKKMRNSEGRIKGDDAEDDRWKKKNRRNQKSTQIAPATTKTEPNVTERQVNKYLQSDRSVDSVEWSRVVVSWC